MDTTNLSGVDLNLLRALEALLAERSVTRAADKLGLSQPGMSRSLARLRELTGDPLLVRTPRGMVLTDGAEQLLPPVRFALDAVNGVLGQRAQFDPSRAKCRFVVATTDYPELVLFPRLLARLSREAPGVELEIQPVFGDIHKTLEMGRADLVIGIIFEEAAGFYRQSLWDDRLVCMVRKDHPGVSDPLAIEEYLALPHVLIAPRGKRGGMVDDALAMRGLDRRVTLKVPHYLGAPHIVAQSDLCLTVAARVANAMSAVLPLRVLELPVTVPAFKVTQFWHERNHLAPAHVWMRGVLQEIATEVAPAPSPNTKR
jgi:DNA-binding transcriptional LysR family regulator